MYGFTIKTKSLYHSAVFIKYMVFTKIIYPLKQTGMLNFTGKEIYFFASILERKEQVYVYKLLPFEKFSLQNINYHDACPMYTTLCVFFFM